MKKRAAYTWIETLSYSSSFLLSTGFSAPAALRTSLYDDNGLCGLWATQSIVIIRIPLALLRDVVS